MLSDGTNSVSIAITILLTSVCKVDKVANRSEYNSRGSGN